MNFPKISFLSACLMAFALQIPALATGEINVEHSNGDIDTYSDVSIANAPQVLYIKSKEGNTMLLITKNECKKEGELLVCDKARAGVDTNGVMEELNMKEIILFINPTKTRQPIEGSKITLSPETFLLEMSTANGNYITGAGKIDSTTRPTGVTE
jgi:hypothetical protein